MPFYIGPQKWWKQLQPPSGIVTNGLVLNLDAGNPASYNPNVGGDTYLLLHADGANDSTTFVDSGTYAHTITPIGNAKISTVKSKFGGSSFRADNTSPFILSQLKFPTVTLSGDFTIGLWVNFDNISGDQALLGAESGNNQLFRFNADNVSGGLMSFSDGYIFEPTANEISFMQSNQWYYLTMTRSGSIVKTFIDGQLLQTNNNFASTITLNTIGAGYLGYQTPFTGYIDDVVILDGTCLYTQSFTAPVAPYPNPGASTTWYDLSGNGNNGTLVNGVGYDSANQGSLVFDGVNDYVNFVDTPSSLSVADGDFTLTAFVKINSSGDFKSIIKRDNSYVQSNENARVISFGVDSSGYMLFGIWDGTYIDDLVYPQNICDGNWHYVVGVYVSSTKTLYLYENGILRTQKVYNNTQSFNSQIQPWCIGKRNNLNNGQFFVGNMGYVSIYNRALTQQEITQNYNALKSRYESIVTNGLVLNLDAGNPASYSGIGTTWYDLSGNNNNATMFNGVSYDSSNGGSLNFNGTTQYAAVPGNSSINVSDITLLIFVYVRNPRREEIILTRDNGSDNGYRLESLLYGSGTSWGFASSPSISYVEIGGGTLLQPNNWYCLTVTRTLTETKLYTNAVLQTTHTNTQNEVLQQGGEFRLAHGVGSAQVFLDGKIGIVQMYNRALTDQEIAQNYNVLKGRFGL